MGFMLRFSSHWISHSHPINSSLSFSMVPGKNWGPVPSPDPTPEDLGVWKALIGQVWVMCPALTQSKVPRGLEGSDWSGMGFICPVLQLGLGQVLETQGLRMGVMLLQEAGQSIIGGC